MPKSPAINAYCATLAGELKQVLTSTWSVKVTCNPLGDADGTVIISFSRLGEASDISDREAFPFDGEGSQMIYDPERRLVAISKPLVAARWSREQAVADGRRVVARVLAGPDGKKAA